MALLAESLQVIPVVRAAVGQLALVVDELGGRQSSLALASLAERVRR